jgi:glycosyltransferase involved in cell wall biosynthesis
MYANTPKVSVIVCTYNRANSLRDTLQALQRQVIPEGFVWETVLVDNNSKDDTAKVAAEFQNPGQSPYLKYFFEGVQGLSNARNRGIAESQGDFLIFTDDDVSPEPDWLATLVEGIESNDCDGAGGWIGPDWEVPPPRWLTERFYGFLAIRTDEGEPYIIDAQWDPPFGANMGFRRSVFDRLGGFDPQLGRKGSATIGGEEWDLFTRLIASGGKVMYFPAARVHHKVPGNRATKAYFRRWRYEESRNQAVVYGFDGDRLILGVPAYIFKQTLNAAWIALKAKFSGPEDNAFHREMIVWHFLGTISGLRGRYLREKSSSV